MKTKKIHVLLSRESFEELKNLKKELFPEDYKVKLQFGDYPDTYEEYLKQEEIKPTMALFG